MLEQGVHGATATNGIRLDFNSGGGVSPTAGSGTCISWSFYLANRVLLAGIFWAAWFLERTLGMADRAGTDRAVSETSLEAADSGAAEVFLLLRLHLLLPCRRQAWERRTGARNDIGWFPAGPAGLDEDGTGIPYDNTHGYVAHAALITS